MILLKALFVLLHVTTAAAWFGLALRLNAQARLALRLEGPAASLAADDLLRTVRQLRLFLVLTFLFGLGAFFTGGGFAAYGPTFHTSLLLVVLLLAGHLTLLHPAARSLHAAITEGRPEAAAPFQKKLSMSTGISHLVWLVVLILMFWPHYLQGLL